MPIQWRVKMKKIAILASLLVLAAATASASAATLTLGDDELSAEFAKEYGPAAVAITDVAGPGVQFDLSGLTNAGTGVGDNFPVSEKAGGAYKNYWSGFSTYGDFSGYDDYKMTFSNNGECGLSVALFVNTGWTQGSGGAQTRDTYWQGGWTTIGPGATATLWLDFDNAEAWNIEDDPDYPGYTNGQTGVSVFRLDEVSNIGFQVLSDCESGSLTAAEYVEEAPSAPEFLSVLIPAAIALAAVGTAFVSRKK